jgi:hypothetical protein
MIPGDTDARAALSVVVRLALLGGRARAELRTLADLDRAIEREFPGAPPRVSREGPVSLDALPADLEGATPARVADFFGRALARSSRKRSGSFFTPEPVARELARRTLAPLRGSETALVVDPAAGAGALLGAAAAALPRCALGGVDADPDAVLLARACLRSLGREPSLVWGDALASSEDATASSEGLLAPPVDFRRAFAQVARGGGADAVLGNPPFVAAYARGAVRLRRARRRLLARRFPETGPGEANGFLHFLELALELARPGGRIGLVLPDAFLVNARYERARRRLVERARDVEARVLDWAVFGAASVRTALVTATRRERPRSRDAGIRVLLFEDEASLESARPSSVQRASSSELEARPSFAFPRGATDLRLESKLRARGRPLETVAWVRDGINPGPHAFRERIVLPAGGPLTGRDVFPCLEGRDVSRYAVAEPRFFVRADPSLLTSELKRRGASFRESWIFEQEKLVSRQTSATLVFAREPRRFRALNSVHMTGLLPDAAIDLRALLALLNSSVLGWYYARTSGETRKVFPQVHIAALRRLPLSLGLWERPELGQALVELASGLERAPRDEELSRAVDEVVAELFELGRGDRRTIRVQARARTTW